MGKSFDRIDEVLREFIEQQPVFFVATAPLSESGHVNCSPKGLDTLRVVSARTLAYLDYHGSGAETIAHVRENGRIVVMCCAFEGPPRIVRFYGQGTVLERGTAGFANLAAHFPASDGARSIIRIDVQRITNSCGFGVPRMAFESHRDQLPAWIERKGEEGLAEYVRDNNLVSIDGLPALTDGEP